MARFAQGARDLPFIDEFNSMFSFITNIDDLINGMNDEDAGPSNQDLLDQLLDNNNLLQDLLDNNQSMQDFLEGMSDELQNQLSGLMDFLNSNHNQLMDQLNYIQEMLEIYLPAIMSMLERIEGQIENLQKGVNQILMTLEGMRRELETVGDNVILNSIIIETAPHIQKLLYANTKMRQMFEAVNEARSPEGTVTLGVLTPLLEWARVVANPGLDSFEFSIEALNSAMQGGSLYSRSPLSAFAGLYDQDLHSYQGSPVGKTYMYCCSIIGILGMAHTTLALARKILGHPVTEQATLFRIRSFRQLALCSATLRGLAKAFGGNPQAVVPRPLNTEGTGGGELRAEASRCLTGFLIRKSGEGVEIRAYQAEPAANYSIKQETLAIINSQRVLFDQYVSGASSGEWGLRFPADMLRAPQNHVITAVTFTNSLPSRSDPRVEIFKRLSLKIETCDYNPETGLMGEQTSTQEFTEADDWIDVGAASMQGEALLTTGILQDVALSPLLAVGIRADAIDRKVYLYAESGFTNFIPSIPITYYPLQGDVMDYGIQGFHGTVQDSVEFVDDEHFGTVAQFSDAGHVSCIPREMFLPEYIKNTEICFSFWAKNTGGGILLAIDSITSGMVLEISSGGGMTAVFGPYSFGGIIHVNAIGTGEWKHCVIALWLVDNDFYGYGFVNGVKAEGYNTTGNMYFLWEDESHAAVTLGLSPEAYGESGFIGQVAHFGFHDHILSSDEVLALYLSQKPPA